MWQSEGGMQVQVAHSKEIPPGEKKFLHGVPAFFSGGTPGGGGGYKKNSHEFFFHPPPCKLAQLFGEGGQKQARVGNGKKKDAQRAPGTLTLPQKAG